MTAFVRKGKRPGIQSLLVSGPKSFSTTPVGEFVSAAPSVTDYLLVAGFGFFQASVPAPQGPASVAQYTFGTHAEAIYNAEAQKHQSFGIARPATVGAPRVGSFHSVGQQFYVDIAAKLQPVARAPAITTGILGQFQNAPPQVFDPTLQPQIQIAATIDVGASSPAIYTFGVHAEALYNAEAIKSAFYHAARAAPPAGPGILGRYQVVAQQQLDYSIVYQSYFKAPPTEFVSTLTTSTFGAQDDPTQIQPQVWKSLFSPPTPKPSIPFQIGGPQQIDLTIQPVISKQAVYQPLPIDNGPTVAPSPPVPGQLDSNVNRASVWTTVPLSVAGLIPPITLPPIELPAGKHRALRNIYRIKVDGQSFEFRSLADALRFLDETKKAAHELAQKVAREATEKQRQTAERLPVPTLAPPKIEISSRDLRPAVSETKREIETIYKQAIIDAEISMLVELENRQRDNEDIIWFL